MVENSNKRICGRSRLREAEATWNSFLILVWHRKNAVCFLYAQGELEGSNPRRLENEHKDTTMPYIDQMGKNDSTTWMENQGPVGYMKNDPPPPRPCPWPLKPQQPSSPWNSDAILGEGRAGCGEGVCACVTRTTLNWLRFLSPTPSRDLKYKLNSVIEK